MGDIPVGHVPTNTLGESLIMIYDSLVKWLSQETLESLRLQNPTIMGRQMVGTVLENSQVSRIKIAMRYSFHEE